MKILGTISKFISHSFRTEQKVVAADINLLGTFIKIKEDRIRYEFVPSSFFSQECYVAKKPSIDLQFSSEGVKKDLSISKIAEVCQLDVDRTAAVIQTLVKTIVSNYIS